MDFLDIKDGHMTVSLDPDDAAFLSAACKAAAANCRDSELVANPFDALGDKGTIALLLETYGAAFDGGMVGSIALFSVQIKEIPKLTLEALQKSGPGWGAGPSARKEGEVGDVS